MTLRRPLFLALAWLLLAFVGLRMVDSAGALIDVRTLLFVVLLPWLAALAVHPPGELGEALRDAFDARPAELPAERRRLSATVLRSLGGWSLAVGLIGTLGTVVANLNAVASSAGQASAGALMAGLGTTLIAAIYGLALKVLLYDPLAEALESASSPLAVELAED